MKIKIKKKLTVLLTLATTISFAACGTTAGDSSSENLQDSISSYTSLVSDSSNPNDDSIQPSENSEEEISSVTSDNVTNEKKVSLVKLQSNGDVDFDKIETKASYDDWLDLYDNDGLFPFYYNRKYGYINETGNIVVENKFDKAEPFSEGKAFVQDSDGLHIIDTNGKILFTYPIEEGWSIEYSNPIKFKYNRAVFAVTGSDNGDDVCKLVVIDNNFSVSVTELYRGGYMVPPDIINTKDFCGASIYRTIYNSAGDTIYEKPYNSNSNGQISVNEKYINIVNDENKWGLMDVTTGKMVIDYKYDCMGTYSEGVIPVCSYDKWGLIDIDGNQLAKNEYKHIYTYSNGVAFAIDKNDKLCIIDKNGNLKSNVNLPIDTTKISDITPFNKNGMAYINADCYPYIISDTGECLLSGVEDSFLRYACKKYIAIKNRNKIDLYKIEN